MKDDTLPRQDTPTQAAAAAARDVRRRLAPFHHPVLQKSLFQIAISLGGFIAASAAMYALAGISYWAALAIAPIAAGLLVRTFIIQHDCGHGAFLRSRRLNDILGSLCSLFTLTPYASWRRQHAGHHGVWNNLDRRNSGADIYSACLTVEEYRSLGPWRRRWHRISRHPLLANIVLPPLVFLVLYRFPFDMPKHWAYERRAVHLTNLALAALIVGLGFAVGFAQLALLQLPVLILASIAGAWLFTVQHRSERTVWAREGKWTAFSAALESTTYLRLTPVLQWFTGNIGLHHVHHLDPRIPNYRLQSGHEAVSELKGVPVLTLLSALKSMPYQLWDERRRRMVTFREASAQNPS